MVFSFHVKQFPVFPAAVPPVILLARHFTREPGERQIPGMP
jgi:hypothetical protein